jgi:hypothetical protein
VKSKLYSGQKYDVRICSNIIIEVACRGTNKARNNFHPKQREKNGYCIGKS